MKIRKHRATAHLNPRVGKRLLAYATMAGVAGCASSASGEVVYTPVHSNVNFNYPIDLNHDGIVDFRIYSSDLSGIGDVEVLPQVQGNRLAAATATCYALPGAAALPAGALVGPKLPFHAGLNCMAWSDSGAGSGAWFGKSAYLGLAFVIDGKLHFGWARMHVSRNFVFCGCIASLDGYAYETVPGKPIVAGDTGATADASAKPRSLGTLALGAPGMKLWRKEPGQE